MADAAKNEPSMDDILSSIRKIVSQDDRRSGADRRSVAGQQPTTSGEVPGPDPKSVPGKSEPVIPRQHTRRAEDQSEELNLASLAGMVRDQQPRADNLDAERAKSSVTPEGLQARQQVQPIAAPSEKKPETSATLADLQRTVTSHFSPAPVEASPQSTADAIPVSGSSNAAQNKSPQEQAQGKNPPTIDQDSSSSPPEGAMTLKDLAKREISASVSSPNAEIASKLEMPEKDRPESTVVPSVKAPAPLAANPQAPIPSVTAETSQAAAKVEAPVASVEDDNVSETESELEAGAFREALVAPATQSAVGSSIDRLKKSVMDDLDAKVESVLRPMLREWLDNNLPAMVENAVREEIERIARQS